MAIGEERILGLGGDRSHRPKRVSPVPPTQFEGASTNNWYRVIPKFAFRQLEDKGVQIFHGSHIYPLDYAECITDVLVSPHS